jgi:hypothetical protein
MGFDELFEHGHKHYNHHHDNQSRYKGDYRTAHSQNQYNNIKQQILINPNYAIGFSNA